MNKLIILLPLILAGCDCDCKKFNIKSFNTYVLNNGKEVKCSHSYNNQCGMDLIGCEDKLEYQCQNNVTKKGKQ